MKAGWSPFENAEAEVMMRGIKTWPGLISFWKNNVYTVQEFHKDTDWGKVIHYMIRRNDESAVPSWKDIQRIKNELAGPKRVAVEVYPAESELVDQANRYHLWVMPEGFRLPFSLKQGSRVHAQAQNGLIEL